MSSFKSCYRVDNVPWYWWPAWMLVSLAAGFTLYAYVIFVRLTSRIHYTPETKHALKSHSIFCVWHQEAWLVFVSLKDLSKHVWLNHPHWYMKPVHITLWLLGVKKLVLGSAGNRGVEAAKELAVELRAGAKTLVTPDGPYGPYHVIKKGTHFLAKDSGIPIVILAITCKRKILLGGWDRKIMPLPFSHILVEARPPVYAAATPEETNAKLEAVWKTS